VLLVHDEVAALERQRVDGVAPPARHALAGVLAAEPPRAGQVGLGQHDRAQQVAGEAGLEAAGRHVHDPAVRRTVERLDEPRGDVAVPQDLDQALRRSVPLGGDDDATVVGEPPAHVVDGALDVAAVGGGLLGREHDGVVLELGVGGERRDRPPRQPDLAGVVAHLHQRPVRRAPRSTGALPRRPPAVAQDASRNSWLVRTRSCARVRTFSGRTPRRTCAAAARRPAAQLVDEHGRERLHALDRVPVGDAGADVAARGACGELAARARTSG
jgi:hypothetical protein